MLRLAYKATVAESTSDLVVYNYDSRFTRTCKAVTYLQELHEDIDLDYFNQGARVFGQTSVQDHKIRGSLKVREMETSVDTFQGSMVVFDYYHRPVYCTWSTEVYGDITVYLSHVFDPWPNVSHGPDFVQDVAYACQVRDGKMTFWQCQTISTPSREPAYVASLEPVNGWIDYCPYNIRDVGLEEPLDLKAWAHFISVTADRLVSEDRKDDQAIHDTLVRESIDDASDSDSVNNIANIISVLQIAHSFVTGKWADTLAKFSRRRKGLNKKDFASLWLSYRYVYCTTKSDIKEELARLARGLDQSPLVRGRAGKTINSSSYHATCIIRPMDYESILGRVRHGLEKLGLSPSWANLWDLVPFSFIVDWFVPFADFAEECRINKRVLESISGGDRMFDILSFVYSVKTELDVDLSNDDFIGHILLSYYDRSAQDYPTVSSEICWYREGKSQKTWSKRVLDAAALILG